MLPRHAIHLCFNWLGRSSPDARVLCDVYVKQMVWMSQMVNVEDFLVPYRGQR